jgi:uncharacterized coiled-coil protein SlyX
MKNDPVTDSDTSERVTKLEERTSSLEKAVAMMHVTITERGTNLDLRFQFITKAIEEIAERYKESQESQKWALRLAASTLLSVIVAASVLALKG